MLFVYSIFHLNLAYSSIPEEKRREVIDRCFWPLLKLSTEERIPIAIEAPGYTLEVIDEIDPLWNKELKSAIMDGFVEFVGSGYSQLIGPIVPSHINKWNLDIGVDVYKAIIGLTPSIWYVNEQAYSQGIIEHYVNINAEAIVMEWNNPRTLHPEWEKELRYYPQVAIGSGDNRVAVIWNDSIIFQKFQRVAHGDITRYDFYTFLSAHKSEIDRNLCIYGNDAEIFDFRPGRFKTEPKMGPENEWRRIKELYLFLFEDNQIMPIFPSAVLRRYPSLPAYKEIRLESPVHPIPVKKQPKYNVTRWAVTGYNNLGINSRCYEIYKRLIDLIELGDSPPYGLHEKKKELCYLWSSDFRSHITRQRWEAYIERLDNQLKETKESFLYTRGLASPDPIEVTVMGLSGKAFKPEIQLARPTASQTPPSGIGFVRDERYLKVFTPYIDVSFNYKRGLSIEGLIFKGIDIPLIGTIPHGYFRDISLSSDWYSANVVLQRPGKPQITDLEYMEPKIRWGEQWIEISGTVGTEAGDIGKRFVLFKERPQMVMEYIFHWDTIPPGSFKVGAITLIPESFERETLFYATHNGGSGLEVFHVGGNTINHTMPGSSVVTASCGLGATEGLVVVGDSKKGLALHFEPHVCAAMPMVIYREAYPSFFARVVFSCGELDESSIEPVKGPLRFNLSIAPLNKRI